MERSDLYQLWKKENEKTPDKIKDYLSDHYTDVLAELCPEKIKSLVPIVNINKNSKPSDINTCLEEISKIDGKLANSLIKQIHEQMVDNKDLITAFNNVMSLDNKVNTSKDNHCAEEEDINIDIDTPPHDVAIVPYNTNTDDEISVFGDNINEKILSTVWMEVGDCVDYITNIKNGIQNMANALSDIYNDGVDLMNILNSNQVSGEATDFEDTQMFQSIAIASQMVDELSEDIDKVIEATLENYAQYDSTYKKQ